MSTSLPMSKKFSTIYPKACFCMNSGFYAKIVTILSKVFPIGMWKTIEP